MDEAPTFVPYYNTKFIGFAVLKIVTVASNFDVNLIHLTPPTFYYKGDA